MHNPITNLAAANVECRRRESRPVATIEMHYDLLAQMLGFPAGTRIEDIGIMADVSNTVQIRLTHPDLAAVAEGEPIPNLNPVFSRTEQDEKPSWTFMRWA
jgi:hypothetical protein